MRRERKKEGREREKGRDALERQVCARRDLRVYLVSYTRYTDYRVTRLPDTHNDGRE